MSKDFYSAPPPTQDDDPARVKFLEELALAKGRQPSNWREVLSTPCAAFERKNQQWREATPKRTKKR